MFISNFNAEFALRSPYTLVHHSCFHLLNQDIRRESITSLIFDESQQFLDKTALPMSAQGQRKESPGFSQDKCFLILATLLDCYSLTGLSSDAF